MTDAIKVLLNRVNVNAWGTKTRCVVKGTFLMKVVSFDLCICIIHPIWRFCMLFIGGSNYSAEHVQKC